MPFRLISLLAALAALVALPAAAQAKKPAPQYYVSLGDSYASGYQPTTGNDGHGFAYQVPGFAKKRGYRLKLVNFGCGGATTTSLLKQKGCPRAARGPSSPDYSKTTQITAAERFIRAHRRNVKLITVSISGNDVTKCARVPLAEVATCVGDALDGINANLSKTVKRLRKAAGRKPKLVGITYPDVILGGWVRPGGRDLAAPSVTVFKDLINPALKKQYESVHGSFVDVTAATGAYTPLTETTTLAPYGEIPVAVADVCKLTWYCARGDIHARTSGYRVIAKLVAAKLPRK
ncbi:MAG TPA: SGNH/GDSL hydrolase family protein [Thermoleophilaceae bacterium]